VEAVTLKVHKPVKKFNVHVVIKEYLNVLTMVMNSKHFMQKVIMSVNIVNEWYLNIWGCFTKVKAHKRPRSTVKCESSIRICTVKKTESKPYY
jgi:hypothetical protein